MLTRTDFYKFSSLKYFFSWAGKMSIATGICTVIFLAAGLIGGLLFAPADYQQGDAFRIIYIHVPCAVLSLAVYVLMSLFVISYLVWRIKLTDILAKVSAPLGATFTALALITGAIWGKPMWGTWWIWDARLTSELILLFIYLAIIALRNAINDTHMSATAGSIITLVGLVDIPIIHYSVFWWNTLHQQPTLFKFAKPSITSAMLYPLLLMLIGFFFYYFTVLLFKARVEILHREKRAAWLNDIGIKLQEEN